MLELVLNLFTINTWIVIKKMFLNIMIMFIKQQFTKIIRWGKSNKLTLKMEHYWYQKFWCQVVKNWQKIIQRHWHLQHCVYYKERNWWLWKYLQCESIVFIYWLCEWIYWRKRLEFIVFTYWSYEWICWRKRCE